MRFAPGAWRYAGVALLAAPFAVFVTIWASIGFLAVAAFTLWFFRDPVRTPAGPGVVSPADGTVSVVEAEGDRLRVGVFMNVTDVHVNRAPLDGVVRSVEHTPGAHRPAFTKDSDRNERVEIDLESCDVSLIAGAFARRITTYVETGDAVARGERVGHIAFGSRVDVLLPQGVTEADLRVERGDSVRAGETVVARRP